MEERTVSIGDKVLSWNRMPFEILHIIASYAPFEMRGVCKRYKRVFDAVYFQGPNGKSSWGKDKRQGLLNIFVAVLRKFHFVIVGDFVKKFLANDNVYEGEIEFYFPAIARAAELVAPLQKALCANYGERHRFELQCSSGTITFKICGDFPYMLKAKLVTKQPEYGVTMPANDLKTYWPNTKEFYEWFARELWSAYMCTEFSYNDIAEIINKPICPRDIEREKLLNAVIFFICCIKRFHIFGGFVRRLLAGENIYDGDIDIEMPYERANLTMDNILYDLENFLGPNYDEECTIERVDCGPNLTRVKIHVADWYQQLDFVRGQVDSDSDFNVNMGKIVGSKPLKPIQVEEIWDAEADWGAENEIVAPPQQEIAEPEFTNRDWREMILVRLDTPYVHEMISSCKTKTLRIHHKPYFETGKPCERTSNMHTRKYFFRVLKMAYRLDLRLTDDWKCSNSKILPYYDVSTRQFRMPCCGKSESPREILCSMTEWEKAENFYEHDPHTELPMNRYNCVDWECPYCGEQVAQKMKALKD